MDKKNIITYGSVVILKGGNVYYMIVTFKPVIEEKVYDYGAIEIPKGLRDFKEVALINKEDIEKVLFEGFIDERINDFLEDIEWYEKKVNEVNE